MDVVAGQASAQGDGGRAELGGAFLADVGRCDVEGGGGFALDSIVVEHGIGADEEFADAVGQIRFRLQADVAFD